MHLMPEQPVAVFNGIASIVATNPKLYHIRNYFSRLDSNADST